ncbi:MAG: citrate/2-methylcitrate synthase [Planctomycetales bacterium]
MTADAIAIHPPAEARPAAKGLKGVVAADSRICRVNGQEGRLMYRGYDIDDLARHSTFEETAFLLFNGELPGRLELDEFRRDWSAGAGVPAPVLDLLRSLPVDTHPMSALRSAVSVLAAYDPRAEDRSEESDPDAVYGKAVRLGAQFPTLVAAIHRLRLGLGPVAPDGSLGIAANFMRMLNDRVPTGDEARAMDLVLILHAEHGFNASTFSARVISATLTDLHSAIAGAVGALKGKLHGGANTEVIRTLEQIDSVDDVAPWVEAQLARKEKIMGFGHAVYQTADPRAKHLKELSRRLGAEQGDPRWFEISARIEELVTPAIGKHCNVDFYSASLQHYLGIPAELFTCVFAASRIVGWCAHVLEQLADNKIIRPSANYVGHALRPYVPISER